MKRCIQTINSFKRNNNRRANWCKAWYARNWKSWAIKGVANWNLAYRAVLIQKIYSIKPGLQCKLPWKGIFHFVQHVYQIEQSKYLKGNTFFSVLIFQKEVEEIIGNGTRENFPEWTILGYEDAWSLHS